MESTKTTFYQSTNFTFNDFQYIRNSKNTPNFSDIRTSTVLIQTELGPTETATWFLDIGDNDGSVGKNAFRIMVAFLDPSGQQSSYRAIDVYNETRTQIMTSSLGRNRWQSMFWTRWIHLFYYLFTL